MSIKLTPAEEPKTEFWSVKKIRWVGGIILGLNIILCIGALYFVPTKLSKVMKESVVTVRLDRTPTFQNGMTLPTWFIYEHDTLCTRQRVTDEDKLLLHALVLGDDSAAVCYHNAVDKLAYKSNEVSEHIGDMLLLTLCFVLLGCIARTFFDYVGRKCYCEGGVEWSKWWSWYVFRLLIGAPVAAFIMVAARCAMFSALFTSADLYTYLVISFLAGFAMMEFMVMLRRTSKALFGNEQTEKKKDTESK